MRHTITRAASLATILGALALTVPGAPWSAPIAGHAVPASLAVCAEEDGSTPGQTFPCVWDATTRGNGQGSSFVLFVAA